MRRNLIPVTITILVGSYGWLQGSPERAAQAQADADREAAIEVRCDQSDGAIRSECEESMRERFASGSATPQGVLRLHCTRWTNDFVPVSEETPPQLCVDRFGGWLRG